MLLQGPAGSLMQMQNAEGMQMQNAKCKMLKLGTLDGLYHSSFWILHSAFCILYSMPPTRTLV